VEAQKGIEKNRGQIWRNISLTITLFTKLGEVFVDKVVVKKKLSHFCEIHSHILVIRATK
jgi:hypothetical protein